MAVVNCAVLGNLFKSNESRLLRAIVDNGISYSGLHGPVAVSLCCLGLVTNVINVLVFAQRSMMTSVNVIFTGIAICDFATMFSYLIYALKFAFKGQTTPATWGWMFFIMVHMFNSVVMHTTSLWLSVAVAYVRKTILGTKNINTGWLKPKRSFYLSAVVFVATFLLNVPTLLAYEIHEKRDKRTNGTYITVGFSELATGKNRECILMRMVMFTHGVLFKFIPCVTLFTLISCLVLTLQQVKRKRRRIKRVVIMDANTPNRQDHSDRTTMLLLIVVSISLITEVPQGLLVILSAMYQDVIGELYPALADLMDVMSLLNSSVNFFVYCIMSSAFRKAFYKLLLPRRYHSRFPTLVTNVPFNSVARFSTVNNGCVQLQATSYSCRDTEGCGDTDEML